MKKKPVEKHMPYMVTVVAIGENCGKLIQQYVEWKQKMLCCNECCNQWWNQHIDQVKGKSYDGIICQHCEKGITVYRDSCSEYCNHE